MLEVHDGEVEKCEWDTFNRAPPMLQHAPLLDQKLDIAHLRSAHTPQSIRINIDQGIVQQIGITLSPGLPTARRSISRREYAVTAVSTPATGLATRDWLEHLGSRCRLEWLRKVSTHLTELETGLQAIATCQNRRRWHLAPFLALLLALLLSHPGRGSALHAEFDVPRFPVHAAFFSLGTNWDQVSRLYSARCLLTSPSTQPHSHRSVISSPQFDAKLRAVSRHTLQAKPLLARLQGVNWRPRAGRRN